MQARAELRRFGTANFFTCNMAPVALVHCLIINYVHGVPLLTVLIRVGVGTPGNKPARAAAFEFALGGTLA